MKLVVDEIYSDPDSIRDLALGLEFSSRARNFPGLRSTRSLIPTEIENAFVTLLKIKDPDALQRIPYSGCFQLMQASDMKRAYVHADTAARWAGLVYLSARTVPTGGTLFYRHKTTGLTRFPDSPDSQLLRDLVRRDRTDPTKWQEIDRIGFVYNRLLIYDALLFHKNGKTWGSSLETARLTHNFFI